MKNKITSMCMVSALGLIFSAYPNKAHADGCTQRSSSSKAANDIVDTAVSAGSFNTLAAALQAADLVDALKDEGPFTVFAPTDEAFAALPDGTLESLLKPENKDQLVSILTYHVSTGKLKSQEVIQRTGVDTLNGQRLDIEVSGKHVRVNQANITKTDILCSNGVIHIIDQVMLPSSNNLVATASSAGSFSTLVAAVKAAGLEQVLSEQGPFTVFAPTDEAFSRLPDGTLESLLKPENRDQLQSILKYHVLDGRVFSDQALATRSAKTLLNEKIKIEKRNGSLHINDAKVLQGDIDASNGVIHVIDTVLIPETEAAAAPKSTAELLKLAIRHGVPLFNHGNERACAAIYEVAIEGVLSNPTSNMCTSKRQMLKIALDEAHNTQSNRSKAWILRNAMDRVLAQSDVQASYMQ